MLRGTNGYWYLLSMLPIPIGTQVALRFDEFFHEIFKPPQITNGNLILAVLLVESNTMTVWQITVKTQQQLLINEISLPLPIEANYAFVVSSSST